MQNLTHIPEHFRPAPFWSWNDELTPDELRIQIRQMHDAGIGGFFMHARSGLRTEYMGDRWMECVKACVDEASKLNMDAWLYDENGWPSGFGGGIVSGMGEKYQQKYLRMRTIPAAEAAPSAHTLAFFTDDGAARLDTAALPKEGSLIEFYYDLNPYYVDNMDASIVRAFLDCTHERYASTLTPQEMSAVRGVFTDEPQLSRNGIPWSLILPEEYQKAYGRDILDDLPRLFLDMEGAPAARVRFWGLCSRLFSINFMKQIGEWCEAHGWQLTGHHVLEETYLSQVTSNGAIMPQYQYYHVPGMDHLGRIEPRITTMKQVTSVAAQTGRSQVLTESFALTGWNMNMRGMKWMYQYQMAHGINYLCQHLAAYSMRGMRKRDYPLASSYQQPWWNDYHVVNDYFARVGMLLASGEISPDILVLHGQSTAWTLFNNSKSCHLLINSYTSSLMAISEALDAQRTEYHYADEEILRTLGCSCRNGVVRIGQMSYKAILLPQLSNLSKEMLRLLESALDAGLPVYGVRNQIQPGILFVDGEPADAAQCAVYNRIRMFDDEATAAKALAGRFERPLVEENEMPAGQIVATRRLFSDLCGRKGTLYYLVNRRAETECRATISLPGDGAVERIDPFTGAFAPMPGHSFAWDFAPADAALFFVNDTPMREGETVAEPPKPLASRLRPIVYVPSQGWKREESSLNMLPLEKCEYSVDGGEWIPEDVIVIQDRLLKLERACNLALRFRFTCAEGFTPALKLGVETPDRFTFLFNGKAFQPEIEGYLFEKAIKVVPLPAPMPGENVLEMRIAYFQAPSVYQLLERARHFEAEFNMRTYDTEIEAVYLLGNFAVRPHSRNPIFNTAPDLPDTSGYAMAIPSELCKEPFLLEPASHSTNISDFAAEGYPFFTGKMRLSKSIMLTRDEAAQGRFLSLMIRGFNTVSVTVNGVKLGSLYWEPYTLEIPKGILKEGENLLEVDVTTSLRNMLGPFHTCNGDAAAVGVGTFIKEPNIVGWIAPPYQPDYCVTLHGITGITIGR